MGEVEGVGEWRGYFLANMFENMSDFTLVIITYPIMAEV